MKKRYSYFQTFVEIASYSLKACSILKETLNNFNSINRDEQLKLMHEVEHTADLTKHDLFYRLTKEFLPPIDREDIIQLAEKIDDVIDAIEDVLINICILNLQAIPQEFIDFTEVIENCCQGLIRVLEEFENYKKSQGLHQWIIEVNRLEEVADKLYFTGVRKLFTNTYDPQKLLVWKEIYDSLEKCADNCEICANLIENIVLKNS